MNSSRQSDSTSRPTQLMAVEIISELLATTDPRALGQTLAEQLHELTGARAVLLLAHRDEPAMHELLYASPPRCATLFSESELSGFCPQCTPGALPKRPEELPVDHPLRVPLLRAGVWSLQRVPLRAGGELQGSLLLLDLAEPDRIDETVELLTLLSPPIALALRNAFAIRHSEEQRQQAEVEFRRSQALLKSVTEGTSDAVYVKDAMGRYLMCNSATAEFVGKPSGEVLGKDDTALFAPDEARQVMAGDRGVMASGVARTFLSTKGPVHDAQGEVIGLFGIARDITERKQVEEALRHRGAQLTAAEVVARMGSWNYDVATDTAVWSDNMFAIFDVDQARRDELVFRTFVENRVHPDDRTRIVACLNTAMAGGPPYDLEYRIRWRDGSEHVIDARAEIDWDAAGQPQRLIGIVQDITERKRAEAVVQARVRLSEYAFGHSLDELLTQMLNEAELLSGSTIGFFHFVETDQKTLSLQAWSTKGLSGNN
ncbi:MAG: PAS domain-containing protein [Acidobacteria bacterium]|nr:PAS domain-containing protein [Acidobacteriota bacterium]